MINFYQFKFDCVVRQLSLFMKLALPSGNGGTEKIPKNLLFFDFPFRGNFVPETQKFFIYLINAVVQVSQVF